MPLRKHHGEPGSWCFSRSLQDADVSTKVQGLYFLSILFHPYILYLYTDRAVSV